MTSGTAESALLVKKLSVTPVCSLSEAKEQFEGRYLNSSHVKLRLDESTQILTPDGETKLVFLKNVLPEPIVASAWRTLQKIHFRPSKDSRRKALRGSGGGEQLFGWLEFPQKGGGTAPILTAETRKQWPEFRALWLLLSFIQYWLWKQLPDIADKQRASADAAREHYVDYLFRVHLQEENTKFLPSRKECMEVYRQLEKDNPAEFEKWFTETFAHFNPEYFESLLGVAEAAQHGVKAAIVPGMKDGAAMMGYTIPGTMFSTVTVNQTALFRSHADGNNLASAMGCLAAFGSFSGGDLCFPRLGVSCPIRPGDLLIGDTNREQHGNIGPLVGSRISVVTYMRNELGTK